MDFATSTKLFMKRNDTNFYVDPDKLRKTTTNRIPLLFDEVMNDLARTTGKTKMNLMKELAIELKKQNR